MENNDVMKNHQQLLMPSCLFPREFISLDIALSLGNIQSIIAEFGDDIMFDPTAINRIALYSHQFMMLMLVKLKPLIVLKDEEKYGPAMFEYGVKRIIEMENKYVRMVEDAKENQSLLSDIVNWQLTRKSNLMEAVFEIVDRFLVVELATHAKTEAVKETARYLTYLDKFHIYLENFFEVTDESIDILTLSKYLFRICQYLIAEIIVMTLNTTHEHVKICTLKSVMSSIHNDSEVIRLVHFRCICYFSPLCLDVSDFTVDDLMPSINLTPLERNESSQDEEASFESLKKKRKLDNSEFELLKSIPIELHEELLKHFDTLETVLRMRLVCKYWNYLLIKTPVIWKYLSYYTLTNNPFFQQYSLVDMKVIDRDSYFISAFEQKILRKETNWFDIFMMRFYHFLREADFMINKVDIDLAKPILKDCIQYCLSFKNYRSYLYNTESKANYHLAFFIDCNTLSGLLTSYLLPSTGGITFFMNYYDRNVCLVEYCEELPTRRRSTINFSQELTETCCLSLDFPNRIGPIVEYLPEGNILDTLAHSLNERVYHFGCPITKSLQLQGCSRENDILLLAKIEEEQVMNFVISKVALKQREFNKCRLYIEEYSNVDLKIDPDYENRN